MSDDASEVLLQQLQFWAGAFLREICQLVFMTFSWFQLVISLLKRCLKKNLEKHRNGDFNSKLMLCKWKLRNMNFGCSKLSGGNFFYKLAQISVYFWYLYKFVERYPTKCTKTHDDIVKSSQSTPNVVNLYLEFITSKLESIRFNLNITEQLQA